MTSSPKDLKLDVPYFSQYRDVRDCDNRPRACGMTCAYMILQYLNAETASLDELVDAGMRDGGYGPSGWFHDYFVHLFRNLGFACERREGLQAADAALLHEALKAGNPVIVSVAWKLWDRKKFHMLVLTGYREGAAGALEGFFYHDPESLQEQGIRHAYVPVDRFVQDWRGMAILPSRAVSGRVGA